MSSDERGGLEPELPRKNVVGLFCGAAFHDVVFARVPGCDVVRLHDWEVRIGKRKLACLFFPEEGLVKVKGMDIRSENIGALEAGVGMAVPAADEWVHVNAGLPCQDGRKATTGGSRRNCASTSRPSSSSFSACKRSTER